MSILWRFAPPAAPVQLAADAHIRIGTLSGPWPLIVDFLGRPAVAVDGYLLEYRAGTDAPHGWSEPVIGTEPGGAPAAVRTPLAAPPHEIDDPTEIDAARGALAARITAERQRRVIALAGDADEQLARVGRIGALTAAIVAETATVEDRTELAALSRVQETISALRAYARVPASPPPTGPALPTAQTLYGWAETLTSAAEINAVAVAAPPVDAPQWPTA